MWTACGSPSIDSGCPYSAFVTTDVDIDLGDVVVGETGIATFGLSVCGRSRATVKDIFLEEGSDDAFEVDFDEPVDVVFDADTPFTVRFTPPEPGPHNGTVRVVGDVVDVFIELQGNGTATK